VGLLLREEDVERVIDMDAVIGAVRAAMIEFGEGVAQNQPRRRVYPPGGVLNVMFASHPGCGHYGLKTYSIGGGRARFLVILYSIEGDRPGSVEALIEANLLGAYRTGAATGVAAAALAPPGPVEVALIGTGFQARTQALALSRAIPVTKFRVFSRNADHKDAFVQEVAERLKVPAAAAETAEEAVRGAPVVVCMTNSATPVIEAGWVEKGALVVGAGINLPSKAELPPDLVNACEAVVVDQLESAKLESGDLLNAEASGGFDWEQVQELGAVLAGKAPGRRSPGGTVLFESHGLALWDVAAGALVLKRAREARLGQVVDLFGDHV